MTAVHVNRMLQEFRSEKTIEFSGKILTVLDFDRLSEAANYEPNYLHLVRTERGDPQVMDRVGDLVPPVHRGQFEDA